MLSVAVVEDRKDAFENLNDCLKKYSENFGVFFQTKHFSDGVSFLSGYKAVYDIIFMDIDMPGMNGLTAAKKLRELDTKVILIFVTNLAQYAIKGYEVDAMDYILKPLNYPAFALKIKKAVAHCGKKESKDIVVNTNSGSMRFMASSIIYVEINAHSIIYHTDSGEFRSYGTMKKVEQLLSDSCFFRCNSCYIVNLKYVSGVEGFNAKVGENELTISHPRKKAFMEALHSYYNAKGEE